MVVGIYGTWAYIACLVFVLMSIGLLWERSMDFNDMVWPDASVRAAIKAAEGRVGAVKVRNSLGPAVDSFGM